MIKINLKAWLEFRLSPSLILVGFYSSFELSRRDKEEYAFKTWRSHSEVMTWQSLATNTGTGMVNRENERVGKIIYRVSTHQSIDQLISNRLM